MLKREKCPPPLKAQLKELNERLQSASESARAARSQEKTLKEELLRVTSDLQASRRGQQRLQTEQKESEREIQELKQQNGRFKNALQVRGASGWDSLAQAFIGTVNQPASSPSFPLSPSFSPS